MAKRSGSGGWFYGFLLGGVLGVAACAVAAFYITEAPIPFVNKVDQASEKINPLSDGTVKDPNAALNNTTNSAPANAPQTKITPVNASAQPAAQTASEEDSKKEAQLQLEEGSRFIVQAGAFRKQQAAEDRRAELGMLGIESKVIARTDSQGTLYRVRIGPFSTMKEASDVKRQLLDNKITAEIGRMK
jgi:cell division protein FtsN